MRNTFTSSKGMANLIKPNASNYDIREHINKDKSRDNSLEGDKKTNGKKTPNQALKGKEEIKVDLDSRNQVNTLPD